jgi:excisionase family DNA binding protein
MIKRRKVTAFDGKRDNVIEKTFPDLPKNDFLSPQEVASFLNVSLRTVYRLYHQGAIQSIGLNQSLKIKKDSLLQYVKNGIGK